MSPKQLTRIAILLLVVLVLWGVAALVRRNEWRDMTATDQPPPTDSTSHQPKQSPRASGTERQ